MPPPTGSLLQPPRPAPRALGPAAGGRSQEDVRRHNLSVVLGAVHRDGSLTRAQLTAVLGLSRSTVGDLVGGLAAAGLVVEDRAPAAVGRGVGRPSLVVRPLERSATALAVYLDVHWLRVAVVGLGGAVLDRATQEVPAGSPPHVVADLVGEVAARLVPDAQDRRRLVGVGAAVPGTVRAGEGVVGLAPNLGWAEQPVGEQVSAAVAHHLGRRLPVVVANDADLGVVAECRRGAARDASDVVYLCGTWGLGGGVVSGGHRLTGSRGFAGEVGHIGVDPEGRACHCGSRGCWESESSAAAWAVPLELDPDAPDIAEQLLDRLDRGGVAARRTRDRVSRAFARGLASVVNVLDPQVVLLGAGLWRDLWPVVADDVLPWVERLVLPALREHVDVRPAGLGEDSTLLGAAEIALAPLLEDPLAVAPG
ncbi:ROK family transcriptional regulator [uncultured Pseudokineococcus sp.]|uniref:ROK family transcriptional regulator n=1 Tax=uncultured Pseudokineococcus sp. TaxID=1642928 RepID=UPI00263024C8|nr:ROK family transcriptional regulator [uncultured Pseudokineococcus sp.]